MARYRMPPTAPIRLMIALPFERSGFGVTSGISATAGDRYVPIAMRSKPSTMMNETVFAVLGAA